MVNKVSKIHLALLVAIVLINCTNALICYFCTSSTSIFNEDCQNGTSKLRFGPCPNGYNFCIARYIEYADGSSSTLRDCSNNNELPLMDAKLPTGFQTHCNSDLCNSGHIGLSTNTESSSSSASSVRTLSFFNWTCVVTLYLLSGVIFLMDTFLNGFYIL